MDWLQCRYFISIETNYHICYVISGHLVKTKARLRINAISPLLWNPIIQIDTVMRPYYPANMDPYTVRHNLNIQTAPESLLIAYLMKYVGMRMIKQWWRTTIAYILLTFSNTFSLYFDILLVDSYPFVRDGVIDPHIFQNDIVWQFFPKSVPGVPIDNISA